MLKFVAGMSASRKIELLAPARDADIAIEAIRHGADAVYMGASSHGARSSAANSTGDVARVVEYAHRFGARVYVTVNTIIYDCELRDVERMVAELYRIGTDALIVQDMALLDMDIPPIALHASTQCDIRNADTARFLAGAGFSQLVLARELGVSEISEIHRAVDVPLEVFVHGALCVSYSGDCQAGFALQGRSANRGECPQICRHAFDLTDERGNVLVRGKHLLSLRDLNRSARLADLMEAGASSFKIEGRLKDAAYVKNVVAYYRRTIDEIIEKNPDRYVRSSTGRSDVTFTPDLNRSFNRGYTEYFTTQRRPQVKMASTDSPKWTGTTVGRVTQCTPRGIKARLTTELSNGDGLGYFDAEGRFCGFRLNRVEGTMLYPATRVSIPAGTELFRNHDRRFQAELEGDTARRRIPVKLTLRRTGRGIAIDAADDAGHSASVATDMELQRARTPQEASRRRLLGRTGDTDFEVTEVTDTAGETFIPNSALADLRRSAMESLGRSIKICHSYDYHRRSDEAVKVSGSSLTYHANVANSVAERFYRAHGAQRVERALESSGRPVGAGTRVMNTRYCIRREFGCCLRTPEGDKWPRGPLYLSDAGESLRVEFDCRNCEMNIFTTALHK